MRNPAVQGGARGDDQVDHRDDTDAVPVGQAIKGVMLGLASCHAVNAFHEISRAMMAADFSGVAVEPIVVASVHKTADDLIAAADRHGHAEVARRFRHRREA